MKIVTSPLKHFSGHVVLHDPLTLPMVASWERATAAARKLAQEGSESRAELQLALLPGVFACVSEWHLDHIDQRQLTPETFPGSPRLESAQLVDWLVTEVGRVYVGEITVPKV